MAKRGCQLRNTWVLFLAWAVFPKIVLADERPQECTAWREKVLTVMDEEASSRGDVLILKKGHVPAEVAQLVAAYPVLSDPPMRSLERDSSVDEVKKAIDEFSRRPPCAILTLYRLVSRVWTAKDFSAVEKKRVLGNLLKLIVQESSIQSLAATNVRLSLLAGAVEAGVLKVSDPLYLKLGSLKSEARKMSAASQAKRWDEKQTACFDKGTCDLKTAWEIFDAIQAMDWDVTRLSDELHWWVKRAMPQS